MQTIEARRSLPVSTNQEQHFSSKMSKYGVYEWTYAGGSFTVALRPNGTFYCAKFPAQATFQAVEDKLLVDWKNYGQYEFGPENNGVFEGSVRGEPANWRRMAFKRDFNETETALLGAGFGSAWNFEWEKGAFEIEFRVDGYNHFVCPQYPAHSHWSLTEDQTVQINWGQYGEYELKLDIPSRSLVGFKKNEPMNWRKASYLRPLANAATGSCDDHAHEHNHKHGESCGHKHNDSCGHSH